MKPTNFVAVYAILVLITLVVFFKPISTATVVSSSGNLHSSMPSILSRLKRDQDPKAAHSFIDLILNVIDSLQFIKQKNTRNARSSSSSSYVRR